MRAKRTWPLWCGEPSPGRRDASKSFRGKSISAEESAGYVIERIGLLDETMRGKLITYDGKVIPL